jgi:hypothetical protein
MQKCRGNYLTFRTTGRNVTDCHGPEIVGIKSIIPYSYPPGALELDTSTDPKKRNRFLFKETVPVI